MLRYSVNRATLKRVGTLRKQGQHPYLTTGRDSGNQELKGALLGRPRSVSGRRNTDQGIILEEDKVPEANPKHDTTSNSSMSLTSHVDSALGFFDWIKILGNMNDEDVRLIAGTDAALYIIFNRYAAIFFLFITLFNTLVFLPIYVTGEPAKKEEIIDKD